MPPSKPATPESELEENRRILHALKLRVTRRLAEGEWVPASEFTAIAGLERQLAKRERELETAATLERLRELTSNPRKRRKRGSDGKSLPAPRRRAR